MVNTRQWVLASNPKDLPKLSGDDATFKLKDTELPALKEGQLLVKTAYLSNDPAQRGWINRFSDPSRAYIPPVEIGAPMRARGLAEVVESKANGFKKGDWVLGGTNWAEYAVLDGEQTQAAPELPGGLNRTHYLGGLGMTGLTAYYGIKEVARATADDIVVVSGAAGATGSMVVQIAKKLIGCKKVYGIAGSDEKCRWVEKLGADKCFNYKNEGWKKELKAATPDFVNVYFDNVGGDMLDFLLTRMAQHGRVAACGAISGYNSPDKMGIRNWFEVISMRIEIKGFIVFDYLHKIEETMNTFRQAIKDGKLSLDSESESVVPTKFEDVPKTWLTLFDGGNTGKLVTAIQYTSSPKL